MSPSVIDNDGFTLVQSQRRRRSYSRKRSTKGERDIRNRSESRSPIKSPPKGRPKEPPPRPPVPSKLDTKSANKFKPVTAP